MSASTRLTPAYDRTYLPRTWPSFVEPRTHEVSTTSNLTESEARSSGCDRCQASSNFPIQEAVSRRYYGVAEKLHRTQLCRVMVAVC